MKEMSVDSSQPGGSFVSRYTPTIVNSYSRRLGGNISRLANSFMGANKKVMTKNVEDSSLILYAAKSIMPGFLNIFSGRKCITDVQVDE